MQNFSYFSTYRGVASLSGGGGPSLVEMLVHMVLHAAVLCCIEVTTRYFIYFTSFL